MERREERKLTNRISAEAHKLILDDLILIGHITGGQYVVEFTKRVFQDVTASTESEIARHMDRFDDWDFAFLFDTILELEDLPDEKFIYFCEQHVHPILRRSYYDSDSDEKIDLTVQCMEAINKVLSDVGLALKPASQTAGREVYKAVPLVQGAQTPIKNIIFAAKYKTDIVLDDALSNGIKIVDANGALVYEDGSPADGISWERICDWYKNEAVEETEKKLAKRFYECLDSDAEELFFKAYILFMKEAGKNIPALIPQVYLYYDPKIQSQREQKYMNIRKWIS